MGIIFIVFVILIVLQLYTKRQQIHSTYKEKVKLLATWQIVTLVILLVILPITIVFLLATDILGSTNENIRAQYDTNTTIRNEGIIIEDSSIKEEIYNQLDKPLDELVFQEELNQITSIKKLEAARIDELSLLKNLESLEIKWTGDNSFISLQNLNKLTFLDIQKAPDVDNIEPIAYIKNLKTFYFSSETVTNIDPLKESNSIETLVLDLPKLKDYSAIEEMISLREVTINGEDIELD